MSSRHLVVSISGHGFGHVAQTAPILNILHQLRPNLRITVRSSVTAAHLRSRIQAPFTHLQTEGDIGMVMISPLEVDIQASLSAYRQFHTDWNRRVDEEALLLKELQADLIFSNVGYLALAGAQQAQIPNVALCSLNWADIYRDCCCVDDSIYRQIQSCYAGVSVFFRTTPGMPMNDIARVIPVAPIAVTGINRRDEINRHLGLSKQEKLILISMGGINSRIAMENWPRIDGIRYLVQANWQTEHPDAILIESLPVSFSDLLASSDALLCKPGYGSFVEACCCAVPVLYVGRPNWPESSALIEWLEQHGRSREISPYALQSGEIAADLEKLWGAEQAKAVIPSGAQQVANWIAEKLR
jgi:hypothetical protein